jgi:hypothetical protein
MAVRKLPAGSSVEVTPSITQSVTLHVTNKMSSSSTSRTDDDARTALGRRPGPPPPKVSSRSRLELMTATIGRLTFRPVLDVSSTSRLTAFAKE